MGRKLKNSDRGTAKFIRIKSDKKWEVIEKLMTLDKFKSNFNKVINDALDYGLPELYAAEFGTVIKDEIPKPRPKEKDNVKDISEDNYLKLVKLIKEVIINENINKSILCSLFQAKENELEGTPSGKQFSKGSYQDTPDFLYDYEVQELRKLRDKEE